MNIGHRSQNLTKAHATEILTVDGFPKGVSLTAHVIEEAQRKLGIKTFNEAERFIRETVRKAVFFGNITEKGGKFNRIFAYDDIVFIFDIYTDEIITVYPRTHTDRLVQSVYDKAVDKTEALVELLQYFHAEEIRWVKRIEHHRLHEREAKAFEQERFLYKFRMKKRTAVRSIAFFLKTEEALMSQKRKAASL